MSWIAGYFYPQKDLGKCKAELRPATAEEIHSKATSKGIYHYIDTVINVLCAPIFVSYRTLFNGILRRSPDLGYAPTGILNAHLSKNPQVMKEIFRYHRNDIEQGVFSHTIVFNAISGVMNKIYPAIQSNDIILTCDPAHTKIYRDFLNQFFTPKSVKVHYNDIEGIIQKTIAQWAASSKPVNLNTEIKLLATSIMAQVFLGYSGPCQEISRASTNMISWVSDNVLSAVSPLYRNLIYYFPILAISSASAKIQTIKVITETVENAIKEASANNTNRTLIKEMIQSKFTNEQIQAMLITLFVAGQDNVSTSLTHVLLKLAQIPSIQEEVRNENNPPMQSASILGLLCESLRMMCPVAGVGRTAARHALLTLTNDKNEEYQTLIQKGDDIQAMVMCAAKDPSLFPEPDRFDIKRHNNQTDFLPNLPHLPFGHGAHVCPGWYLYYVISAMTVSHLVKTYKITTSFTGEPRTKPGFVNTLKDTIEINLERL